MWDRAHDCMITDEIHTLEIKNLKIENKVAKMTLIHSPTNCIQSIEIITRKENSIWKLEWIDGFTLYDDLKE